MTPDPDWDPASTSAHVPECFLDHLHAFCLHAEAINIPRNSVTCSCEIVLQILARDGSR